MAAGLNSVQDIIGKTDRQLFSSLMDDARLSKIEATDHQIMETGVGENIREEGVNRYGQPAIYMTKKIPLYDESGSIVGLMGTSIDNTKEVNAEITRSDRYSGFC